MAIFKPSSLVEGISGTLGGANFVTGKNGNVIRKRRLKKPALSEKQIKRQSLFAEAIRRWTHILNDQQRTEWSVIAKDLSTTNRLGETRQLTGRGLFIRQVSSGGFVSTSLDTPGEFAAANQFVGIDLVAEVGGPFTWTAEETTSNFEFNFKLDFARPFTDSHVNQAHRWRRSNTELLRLPAPGFPQDIFDLFVTEWGAPSLGERIAIRWKTGGSFTTLPGASGQLFRTVIA